MKSYIKSVYRIVFNFQPMRNYYPYANTWSIIKWRMARSLRNVSIVLLFALVAFISAKIYNALNPITVYADKIVTVKDTSLSPVMQRILKCESSGSHVRKDGQVVVHVNSNGSYDIGIMQINSIHNSEATKLGYNLSVEKDNIAYAVYLYENYGTEAWYSSKACWSKK